MRTKDSTDLCLSYLNDKILKDFGNGLFTSTVLIDLQKAFDTTDYNILLEKLSAIGFCDNTVNWFHSYLTDQAFLVSTQKKYSNISKISCGVPKGSVLGPLLILIYQCMKQAVSSDLILYADDSRLVFQQKHVSEIETHLNNDFNNLCEQVLDNKKVSILERTYKTKSILFGTKCILRKVGNEWMGVTDPQAEIIN